MISYCKIWGVALLAALPMAAQPLSVGIEGGLPLTAVSQGPGCCCCGVDVNRYLVGLTGEVRLCRRFSFEVDGLLQRVHTDYSVFVRSALTGTEGRISGYGWEFPLLLKYSLRRSRFPPFFDAGATIRHVGRLRGAGYSYAFWYPSPQPVQIDIDSGKPFGVGIPFGAGVAIKAGPFRIAPEIRYTRWTEGFYQPTRNEAALLVRNVFP